MNVPAKTILPEAELEAQVVAVAEALRKDYTRLHAERAAIYNEAAALREMPPSRADLERFLTGFIDLVMNKEPRGENLKLLERLERFRKNPYDVEAIKQSWLDSFHSGLDDFTWLLFPLLESSLRDGAAKLAATIPWPDTDLDEAKRNAKISDLEAKATALLDKAFAVADRAARLNIKLD